MSFQPHQRAKQVTGCGPLGTQFASPSKSRHTGRSKHIIRPPGHHLKKRQLLDKLLALQQFKDPTPIGADGIQDVPMDTIEDSWIDVPDDGPHSTLRCQPPAPKKRIVPDNDAHVLYNSWMNLIPTLTNSLLNYTSASLGRRMVPADNISSSCTSGICVPKLAEILCLHFDRKPSIPCLLIDSLQPSHQIL